MAKHCTNCGHELQGSEKFCAECGTPTGGTVANVGGGDLVDTVRQLRSAQRVVEAEEHARAVQKKKAAQQPGRIMMGIGVVVAILGALPGASGAGNSSATFIISSIGILLFVVGFCIWGSHMWDA